MKSSTFSNVLQPNSNEKSSSNFALEDLQKAYDLLKEEKRYVYAVHKKTGKRVKVEVQCSLFQNFEPKLVLDGIGLFSAEELVQEYDIYEFNKETVEAFEELLFKKKE